MNAASHVRAERRGALGILTLDRTAALNALTLDMIRALQRQLDAWAADPSVQAVLLRGAGDKAFCAGGDVRALRDAQLAGSDAPQAFFSEEYRLDVFIHRYPKPVIAWMDGIVMGGGMGLAQGAALRIATERTRIAMPEVGIGFFPDVGGSWFLSRLPGALGLYLGLTGQRINGADAVYCGLADCLASSDDADAVVEALAGIAWQSALRAVLLDALADRFGVTANAVNSGLVAPPTAASLPALHARIDHHFGQPDVAAIFASLAADEDDAWARDTLALLRARSPLAVLVTFEQLRRGQKMRLEDCFAMELAMTGHWLPRGDFIEGVRALLVDKDNAPRWRHASIEDVPAAEVQGFFAPLEEVSHA
ncbi:enoyl-CoA hydratase/isomerase family protein [Derxia lacustris]|uniref:enoyl-CoA hydratase/isomerase family protein n=1 Tax=Derxia lacustris TaxID=764842 RepID=UPI000A1785CF|nr:enoyl-CoA hydratase/isomerase family protein [Derxia lacustris]